MQSRLIAVILTLASLAYSLVRAETPDVPLVEPVDWKKVTIDQFTDEELRPGWMKRPLPYYLDHLFTLANSVVTSGPEAGWIDRRVWRSSEEFDERDPRVMEVVLAFIYFYSENRPWNPYYKDSALRQRLELSLRYYLSKLAADGLMMPRVPDQPIGYRLATTMFFTKYMGEALKILQAGPEIDPQLHTDLREGVRRALKFALSSDLTAAQGRKFSNQFGNVFSGAYAYLSIVDDSEISGLLERSIRETVPLMQSPAGYMYEGNAMDFGYTLGTHHSNIYGAWHNAGPAKKDISWLKRESERWAEWLSYNAVAEPDFSYFFLNRAIETRQSKAGFRRADAPFARDVPILRAMVSTQEEVAKADRKNRAALSARWPSFGRLERAFDSYSPYAFLDRSYYTWFPSTAESETARKSLPYLARENFTHQRVDDRREFVASFIRRPGYYAIFNAGDSANSGQTFGLSLLWNPRLGTLLQSQSNAPDYAWGTVLKGAKKVVEHHGLKARYFLSSEEFHPEVGNRDLGEGLFEIHYRAGKHGEKYLRFDDGQLLVVINSDGRFTEQIPVLIEPGTTPVVSAKEIRIPRNQGALVISSEGQTGQSFETTKQVINGKTLGVVKLQGLSRLSYSLYFE